MMFSTAEMVIKLIASDITNAAKIHSVKLRCEVSKHVPF